MKILSVRHNGLRLFIGGNRPKGIRADLVARVRNILAAVISAHDVEGVKGPPGWRAHQLSGSRSGTWSLSVSGNWRITFRVEDSMIADLDLEDYH